MTKLALRGLAARKLRALLIGLAVFFGVAMISGTFVLTDTINSAFDQLFTAQTKGSDAVISPKREFQTQGTLPKPFDASLLEKVRGLPQVSNAAGEIQDTAALVGKNGKVVANGGAPTFAISFPPPGFTEIRVVDGKAPSGPDEIALDTETARNQGLKVGDKVPIATGKPRKEYTVTGLITFGTGASIGGATFVIFDFDTAAELFNKQDKLDLMYVSAKNGVSPEQLAQAIKPLLPQGVQARTAAQEVEAQLDDIGDALGFINTGLLAFAFIAVLVGAFTIFNAFSITVVQRTREIGLMRAIGTTRGQVMRMILLEAMIIGVLGSVAGLFGGLLFARGVEGLFDALGVNLPSSNPVLEQRTVIVSLAVGILVTLIAAGVPAIRATRVAPLEALRTAGVGMTTRGHRTASVVSAAVLTLLGIGLVSAGLLSDVADSTTRLISAAGGAVVLIIGIALLTPFFVRPVARVIGMPGERFTRVVGRLARENTQRIPGRTAVTSATLMIGLAIVLFVTIFANGVSGSIDKAIDQRILAEIGIFHENSFSPFPVSAAEAAGKVPGVAVLSTFKSGDTKLVGRSGGSVLTGIDPATVNDVYNFDWKQGGPELLSQLGDDGSIMEEGTAKQAKLKVGQSFTIKTPSGLTKKLVLRGTYKDSGILSGFAIPLTTFTALYGAQPASFALAKVAEEADAKKVLADVNVALKEFPEARARSEQEIKDERRAQVQGILGLFYALLMLSVVISMFGIVNTLTLSIHERTRELGLLRAVGMTQRDVRRMIRYESVITAVLGGVLGMVLGLFFAFVVIEALSDEGIAFSVPVGQIIGLMIFAMIVGVIAAIGPARRASKMDVLQAISHE